MEPRILVTSSTGGDTNLAVSMTRCGEGYVSVTILSSLLSVGESEMEHFYNLRRFYFLFGGKYVILKFPLIT